MKNDYDFFKDLKDRALLVKIKAELGGKADLVMIMQMLLQKDFMDMMDIKFKPVKRATPSIKK